MYVWMVIVTGPCCSWRFVLTRFRPFLFVLTLTCTVANRYHPKCVRTDTFSVNNILFKYKVHRDTTDTSYIQYNTFERDTEISLRLV